VQPDADHADLRVHRGEERRVGVGGAVVRDLQHIRTQIHAGGE
jgi:hypothetical protein